MQIKFSGKCGINNDTLFGVNFEAIVDGEKFVCKISAEALDDIEPSNVVGDPMQKFHRNREEFKAIAKRKILAGAKSPVCISSADVSPNNPES